MANKGFVGTQVTAFVIIIASSFLAVGAATGSEALVASQVTWQEHFGSSTADTNTLFSLMAHGYFRAESTNVQRVVDTWLRDHPRAVVISVSTGGPVMTRFPSSRLTYVWVVQGSDSLNVELVRRGCIAPETQILNPDRSLRSHRRIMSYLLRESPRLEKLQRSIRLVFGKELENKLCA